MDLSFRVSSFANTHVPALSYYIGLWSLTLYFVDNSASFEGGGVYALANNSFALARSTLSCKNRFLRIAHHLFY